MSAKAASPYSVKPNQILVLEPSGELKFKGPFTAVVTSELKLQNPSSKRVLFKVKTTAPKRYCVRPNSGILEAGAAVVVAVMLQPFDNDSVEHSKHRFMVQSMLAPDEPVENLDQLWKEAEPSQLMDSKLRCVFEMSPDSALGVNLGREDVVKPAYSKDVSSAETLSASPAPFSKGEDEATNSRKLMEEKQKLLNDIDRLHAENDSLKTDAVRLRKLALSDTVSSTPSQSKLAAASVPTTVQGFVIPVAAYFYIAVLIVGVIVGKLLL